jgi:hypothetical protein
MKTFIRLACATTVAVALATPVVLAHHSAAAFDTQKQVTINGVIKSYRYANPHVLLLVDVKQEDGSTVTMDVEAGAASVLNGLGFTKDALKVGDLVTISGNPSRANAKSMLGRDLYKKPDGTFVPLNISSKSIYEAKVNATATTIAGTWFSPMRSFTGVMGAVNRVPVTEKGKAAKATIDPRLSSQKDCIPVGEPTVMVYPVATSIDVQKDKVVLKTDWMETERTVYLDGRKHPAATQTFLHGHSVGKWEGTALVVETTNFKEHASGLTTTLPSSTQKKLVERFEVGEDGKTLKYSGTLEDPVYLTGPAQFNAQLEYRPGMPFSNQKCDIQIAQKYLKEL